jgi:hypothetical protein
MPMVKALVQKKLSDRERETVAYNLTSRHDLEFFVRKLVLLAMHIWLFRRHILKY